MEKTVESIYLFLTTSSPTAAVFREVKGQEEIGFIGNRFKYDYVKRMFKHWITLHVDISSEVIFLVVTVDDQF